MIEPQLLESAGWVFRLLPAERKPTRLLVLVHGFTGDENSMWMLVQHFPADYTILAPQAPFPASEGGYTWRKEDQPNAGLPADADLLPAAKDLLDFLDHWQMSAGMNGQRFDVMGFSQGAALVYLLALLEPKQVDRLAGLSGFLPEGLEDDLPGMRLSGKQVFVSHGSRDELIPLERARRDVARLKEWGAEVTYCESDAGHKVSRECLLALREFFQ